MGFPTRSIPQLRDSLLSIANSPDALWHRKTPKARRNALLRACELEFTFAPRVVRETIVKDDNGELKSLCTGQDGRKLWLGPVRKKLYVSEGDSKFTRIRNLPSFNRRKADRFSYLISVLTDCKLSKKAVKPLVRLCVQFSQLNWSSFQKIVRAVIASLCTKIKVRRIPQATGATAVKPHLLGVEIKSDFKSVSVPLWDWIPIKGH